MVSILPIIKKNLILTKRSSIKSFLQLFYPTIFVAIFTLIDHFTNTITTNLPITTYYNSKTLFELNDTSYSVLVQKLTNYYNSSIALVVSDADVKQSLTTFIWNISNLLIKML